MEGEGLPTREVSVNDPLRPLDTDLLSVRVKERLQNGIIDGAFEGLLPSETELARQLGVSRPTVRNALQSLEEEGLITRRRGVGTLINPHVARVRLTLNRVVGFWDLIRDAGHEPSIAYTRLREAPADIELATRLECEPGDTLALIDRLFLADGEPAIAVTETIPRAELRSPVSADEVAESIFVFAEQHAKHSIDHTVVEIVPAVADARLSELLGVDVGSPLLHLIETCYSRDNHLLMVALVHVVDRFVRFHLVRRT